MLHVLQINFFLDPERTPEAMLEDWHSLSDIALAARTAGLRVSVVQASRTAAYRSRHGIDFHFIATAGLPLTRAPPFRQLLHRLQPDVAHVHGLGFPRELLELRRLAPQLPMLAQDHANRVPRFWRRPTWRKALSACAAVTFCAREQALEFRRAGLLDARTRVFQIPESTSAFIPGDSREARAETGVSGDPAVLWVAHLDANKDPLTVLDAVSAVAREWPGIELWCCFGSAPLRQAVEARIAGDSRLAARVHLLGRVPHERVETLMRAADIFVLGSHREGSSFSLIEALATGLTPVVTDIPSLRALTGNGTVGQLWPVGDAPACARALMSAASARGPSQRAVVRAWFDATLSHAALGQELANAYGHIARLPLARPAA